MTRDDIKAILTEAGVTDEAKAKVAIDKTLNQHNAEIAEAKKVDEGKFVAKEQYDALETKLAEATALNSSRKNYDELVKFKSDTLAKQASDKKADAVIALLKGKNANEKAVKLLAKEFDLSKVELDDKGNVKDGDALVKPVIDAYPDFFTKAKEGGPNPGNPAPGSGSAVTKEQFAKMGYGERAKLYETDKNLYETLKEGK